MEIPRSTLAECIGICGVRLQPLIDALREALLTEPILHADKTLVPMLVPGKKETQKAYLWAYATTLRVATTGYLPDHCEAASVPPIS